MKSIHNGVKHCCEFSKFKATTKSILQQHVKSIHDGDQHNCDFCNYKASEKTQTQQH